MCMFRDALLFALNSALRVWANNPPRSFERVQRGSRIVATYDSNNPGISDASVSRTDLPHLYVQMRQRADWHFLIPDLNIVEPLRGYIMYIFSHRNSDCEFHEDIIRRVQEHFYIVLDSLKLLKEETHFCAISAVHN